MPALDVNLARLWIENIFPCPLLDLASSKTVLKRNVRSWAWLSMTLFLGLLAGEVRVGGHRLLRSVRWRFAKAGIVVLSLYALDLLLELLDLHAQSEHSH